MLQGAAAARRDAPHLVPEAVTRRGLPSAQCARPSLMGVPCSFFTLRRGRRAAALTSMQTPGILYLRRRATALHLAARTVTGRRHRPHQAPKSVTGSGARVLRCARLLQGGQSCDGAAAACRHSPSVYAENRHTPSLLTEKCYRPPYLGQNRDGDAAGVVTCANMLSPLAVQRQIHLLFRFREANCRATRNRTVTFDSIKRL